VVSGAEASTSHSDQALAALAQAFNVQADVLNTAVQLAEEAIDYGMELGWGPAGNLTRAFYLVPAAEASGALNALAGALTDTASALTALAQSYGASEADTAGLFGQIAGTLEGGEGS
jgi:hypothetical protein